MRIFTAIILNIIFVLTLSGTSYSHHAETFITLKRVPPVIPAETYQSGYCCMSYAIDAKGNVLKVKAKYCTENFLARSSVEALSKWKYGLKRKNGASVQTPYETTFMSFVIAYENGEIIPGKNGYMTLLKDGSRNKEKICSPDIIS